MAPAKKKSPLKKKKKSPKGRNLCFVIMPFGGYFDDYYELVYRPAIEKAGLEPKRADDLYRPSTIVTDIWTHTREAQLILADLSGKNPNVFYELGLAHALAKPAILITESIDDVPFDLRALRILEYNKSRPRWGEELGEKITRSIQEVVASPLEAVLPAFLTVRNETKPKAITEQEKAYLELKSEFDLLRSEVARSNRPYFGTRSISVGEAEEMISYYVSRGMPEKQIYMKLVEAGAPANWTRRKIVEKMRARRTIAGKS